MLPFLESNGIRFECLVFYYHLCILQFSIFIHAQVSSPCRAVLFSSSAFCAAFLCLKRCGTMFDVIAPYKNDKEKCGIMMNYITKRRNHTLSNEPFEITFDDIERLCRENLKDRMECQRVTESSYRGESYYAGDHRFGEEKEKDFLAAFFKETLYRDAKTCGFTMQYPHGIVIGQGERNHYYRGENRIYPKSQASLHRFLEKLSTEKERQLYRLVADMRIEAFGAFLRRLAIVQFWEEHYSDILIDPLAQHYGLDTTWLDITNDFEVALFFATCQWDAEKKIWNPLTKKEADELQYGVIFHIPGWRAKERLMLTGLTSKSGMKHELNNVILPIGFQPFRRCHHQYAYGISMDKPSPLQDDIGFEKLHFKHSVKLSNKIYEMMEGGRKIYPHEGLNDFQDVIDSIRHATLFSNATLRNALKRHPQVSDIDQCRKELERSAIFDSPVIITDGNSPTGVTRQRIRALDRKYEGFSIEKEYGIRLSTRMVYTPPE
jgi:hypothetical protein